MRDQAENLRNRLKQQSTRKHAKTLAVVSGKGGVGKSNFSLNFCISLAKRGSRVLLFDLDIGMGNIEILMGRTSSLSIADYLTGRSDLKDIIAEAPGGIQYISGGSGLNQLISLDDSDTSRFIDDLQDIMSGYDYLIFDMGAGLTPETLKILLSVNEIFVITTPEPTAIMDAYATMKHIHHQDKGIPFYILANRVRSQKEGTETLQRLSSVLKKFLGKELLQLGMLPDDQTVQTAVRNQVPFMHYNGKAPAARAMERIVDHYESRQNGMTVAGKQRTFASRLKQLIFER
ncbi:MinD/ParA family protein [Bacillus sp. T33-2]|uniref:MinD/ParA family protein n=1 Tax=Bacillus sp. T33-2 TaxID=2054168 RepID=UPI000C762872|nr:MinD/ParA family protein [Bacillus sp. T33-2]PLR97260.1 cobyrinic acid a,c-diamide synthase [Bacillus sp. T33-2]